MGEHSRDDAWFDSMYRRCAPAVLAYARRRLTRPQDGEDVVVEVFAIAWRRRDDMPSDELPWLYATAANVIAHVARSEARRGRLDAKLASHAEVRPEDHTAPIEARTALAAAFVMMSEADQEVLRLWAWEDLDGPALADALDCAPGAARTRLHRAKTRLRTALTAADDRKEGIG